MISRGTMRVAAHITKSLVAREMHNPNPTIFDDAIRYLVPHVANRPKLSFEDAVSGVSDVAQAVDDNGYSAQEVALQDAVELLMGAQVRQFNYVRDTVMPFISQTSADVLERIKDSEPKEPTVAEWRPSAAVLDPSVREMVSKYRQASEVTSLISSASECDEAALIQGMKTGLPDLDDAIAAALAEQGTGVITELYDAFFRGKWNQQGSGAGAELYRVVQKTEKGAYMVRAFSRKYVDLAILAFFLIDSVIESPVAGTGKTLAEYESIMVPLRNAIGASVRQSLENYDNDIKHGVLIISAPQVNDANVLRFNGDDLTILVHGDVYAKFLANGGAPECIIGGCLLRERETYLDAYIKNKEAYHRQYHRAMANRDEFVRKSVGMRVCSAICDSVTSRLNDVPTFDLPATYNRDKVVAAVRQEVESSVRELTEAWNTEEPLNVYHVVEGLVAAHVFAFVDAKTIIDLINANFANVTADNSESSDNVMFDEVNVDTAVWMAFMQYLARWAAANFPTTAAK